MDEKTKLYVFTKKEVALIFIFMMLIGLASFSLGVKLGKKYTFKNEGFSHEDKQVVDMLSGQEEMVEKIEAEKKVESSDNPDEETKVKLKEDSHELLKKKIVEQLSAEQKKIDGPSSPVKKKIEQIKKSEIVKEVVKNGVPAVDPVISKSIQDSYSGKYTIQLSSHRSISEAEEFANGFKIKGYNPIISEANIKGRGTWYRVSIGVFDSMSEASEYLKKEKELFLGQDHVFRQFD